MDERSKSPEQPNLRERKQRLLRLELGEVALNLFVERGFAETTIEDIAEAAGISRRTFFRYFETKEDVVLWRLRYSSEQLGDSLEALPADEPPLPAVRKALGAVSAVYMTEPERSRSYLRFLLETPTLRAHFLDTQEQWRALLARILAARLGAGRGKKELAQLTAGVAIAALDVALRRWAEDGSRSLPEYVDETFAALPEVLAASPGPSAPATKRARR